MRPRLLDLLPQSIASRIDTNGNCWRWAGWHNNLGYPYVRWEGRDRPVHRIILGLVQGEPIAAGLDVDHLCRNPNCVNPAHLEAVSHRVNIKRGRSGTKTSCNYGHDWTDPKNVYYRADGRRWCAACARERWQKKAV